MKLCVLQSDFCDSEYGDDDSPASVQEHVARAAANAAASAAAAASSLLSSSSSSSSSSSVNNQYQDVVVENVLLQAGKVVPTLMELSRRYARGELDCIVNLCDGAWDEPSPGGEVVDMLENKLHLPFTGAGCRFYEPTRLEMKKVALSVMQPDGFKVPAWRFVYSQDELEDFVTNNNLAASGTTPGTARMRFPMITKHFSSYSSIGLTEKSKCCSIQELRQQATIMLQKYGGCLIEEFVEGREYTVLVAQVPSADGTGVDYVAYDAIECKFGDGQEFKHYQLKWVDYDSISWHPVQDATLNERLKSMAMRTFAAMPGARGYARIDVRSDMSGENLYFLEINPNCGIFYPQGLYGSADFILDRADPVCGHADLLLNQVKVAQILHKQQLQNAANDGTDDGRNLYEARYDGVKESWGLYAIRDIEKGEIIQWNEEKPVHLVSKSHVLRHWDGAPAPDSSDDTSVEKKSTTTTSTATVSAIIAHTTWDNFTAYCWPVNDSLFAMWDPDPNRWAPINHSCDPNAWNETGNGLNIAARRKIRAGEEIRLDYATFVGYFPEMKSFDCDCGSTNCRGSVTGMDIVNYPNLAQLYKGHMSEYVASKARMFHGDDILPSSILTGKIGLSKCISSVSTTTHTASSSIAAGDSDQDDDK